MSIDELEALLLVQDSDITLDQLRHRREAMPERAELTARARPIYAEPNRSGRRSANAIGPCSPRRSGIDDEAQTVGERADEVNKKLYSGTISSPRELQAMQADIDMLHRRRSDLEDEELEVMEQRETLDAALATLDATIASLQARVTELTAMIAASEAGARRGDRARDGVARFAGGADRGDVAARLRAPAGAEPRCGGGPAGRHHVPGLPPHDPVDGSRAGPSRCGPRRLVLRQLLRDPRAVTQDSLFAAPADAPVTDTPAPEQLDEVLVFSDGGSRGNPGPSAIGAVVLDPSTDPPAAARRGERVHRGHDEQRRRVPRAHRRPRSGRAFRARAVRVRADSKLVIEQVKGTWKVKQPHLRPLLEEARALLAGYEVVDLRHVPARRTMPPTRS